MLTYLRRFGPKTKMALISWHIYDNWSTKRRFNAGKIELTSGSTHLKKTLSESLRYVDQVFDDYLTYSAISVDMLRDKRILEIGPGDNIGVALKFLVAGAKQVVCLDKFFSKYDWEQQRKIYQSLRDQWSEDERQIFDEVIDLEKGSKVESQKLLYLYGTGIEEAEKIFEPESFDLIVSRAVFEHLYNPNSAFSVMSRLLKPDGYMLHKIDFKDHGVFSKHNHHPLTFLTIPSPIYKLMTYDSGKPNRRLINFYRQKLTGLEFDSKILITQIVGVENEIVPHKEIVSFGVDYTDTTLSLLKKIRPRLQIDFKDMSDEDLMVSGIFLIARKP
jgi:SAM-dependent methyltransferase